MLAAVSELRLTRMAVGVEGGVEVAVVRGGEAEAALQLLVVRRGPRLSPGASGKAVMGLVSSGSDSPSPLRRRSTLRTRTGAPGSIV